MIDMSELTLWVKDFFLIYTASKCQVMELATLSYIINVIMLQEVMSTCMLTCVIDVSTVPLLSETEGFISGSECSTM